MNAESKRWCSLGRTSCCGGKTWLGTSFPSRWHQQLVSPSLHRTTFFLMPPYSQRQWGVLKPSRYFHVFPFLPALATITAGFFPSCLGPELPVAALGWNVWSQDWGLTLHLPTPPSWEVFACSELTVHQPLLTSSRKQHPARGKHHLAWVGPRAACWGLLAFLDVFKSGLVKQRKLSLPKV